MQEHQAVLIAFNPILQNLNDSGPARTGKIFAVCLLYLPH